MALKGNLTDAQVGYVFPDSYARVEFSRVFKTDTLIFVHWYADEQARWDEKFPVKTKEFVMPTTQLAGYASFYGWLKTQPEFAGWVDV